MIDEALEDPEPEPDLNETGLWQVTTPLGRADVYVENIDGMYRAVTTKYPDKEITGSNLVDVLDRVREMLIQEDAK